MVQMKQHFQRCAESVPPRPPLSLSQQLDKLLPPYRRQHFWNVGSKFMDDQAIAVDLDRKRYKAWSGIFVPKMRPLTTTIFLLRCNYFRMEHGSNWMLFPIPCLCPGMEHVSNQDTFCIKMSVLCTLGRSFFLL